jgi:putative glutamine amidotransferase
MIDDSFGMPGAAHREVAPLIGVLCCNEFCERPVQVVASRFIEPLASISVAAVLLVPAMANCLDVDALVRRLDGLLLTGSRSNVAADRYGGTPDEGPLDLARDEVAFRLAGTMIERGKPVFGICRGFQELNVLFGGTLRNLESDHHQRDLGSDLGYEHLFEHMHDIDLDPDGLLAGGKEGRRISVNSVHLQGVDRLGNGLSVEAVSSLDGVVEAFSARQGRARILAVQWHPEWNGAQCATSRIFFEWIGGALRGSDDRYCRLEGFEPVI